jgi:putative DNA primase/helicase
MNEELPPWAGEVFELKQPDKPQADVWASLRKQGNANDLRTSFDIDNVIRILEEDDRWRGRLRYNDFTALPELDGRPMRDTDEVSCALWLSRTYRMSNPSTSKLSEMMRYIASTDSYHPVRDYLNGLQWDGKPRVDLLLSGYFKADDSPLHRVLSRCFLVSCVARVMVPGCKVDTTLILKGRQGAKKSSGLQALAGADWFSDTPIEIGHKDGYAALNGIWLYEFGELDSMSRKEMTAVKGFLSAQKDRYRPSYGRHAQTFMRQTVTTGTTNKSDFLRDETGSRRFWPVEVGNPDLNAITEDRDHLWAEAVQAYASGWRWWLDENQSADLVEASRQFEDTDSWEPDIIDWATGREGFTMAALLDGALDIKAGKSTTRDQTRAGKILRRAGWHNWRKRGHKNRSMCWWSTPRVRVV